MTLNAERSLVLPPERRLLKRAGRIEPNETKLEPQDKVPSQQLEHLGLIEVVSMYAGRYKGAKITAVGRKALG